MEEKTKTQVDLERELYECTCKPILLRDSKGEYKEPFARHGWVIWQLARLTN